jgi:hypothetical protein
MPIFQIELDDGRKFEVDAVDQQSALAALNPGVNNSQRLDRYHQRARDVINEQAARGRDISGGYLDKYLQGATMGFGDEIVAGMRTGLGAVVDPLRHIGDANYKSPSIAERYNYEKALEDERAKDADKRTGALGALTEFAGGLGTGVGAARSGLTLLKGGQTLGQMARAGALEGAGYGAVSGAGEGDGINDRLRKAFSGGVTGAALGGALPLAAEGIKVAAAKPLSNILAARDPQSAAVAKFAEDLRSSGKSLDQVKLEIDSANAAGIPVTLADVLGKEGQRRLYTAAGASGPGREFATNFLDQRQAGQAGRIANLFDEALGADRTAKQAGEEFIDQARRQSEPFYKAIPEYPSQITPRVENFLKEPLMEEALKKGIQIQRNNAIAAGEDLSGYTLRETQRANDAGLNSFNFKNYQAMKIGLDDMLEQYRDKTTGKLVLDTYGKSILKMRQALDNDLKQMFPGYAKADALYSGPASIDQAIGLGKQMAGSGRYEDNIAAFNNLTDAQKVGARLGYADNKLSAIQRRSEGTNNANNLINPKTQNELEAMSLYQGPIQPNSPSEIRRRLDLENTMAKTRNMALGGSRTAENQADMAGAGIDPRLFSALGQLISGNVKGALSSGGQFISTYGGGNTPAVREQLAKLYLSNGNVDLASLLRKVNQQSQKWNKRQKEAIQGLLSAGAIQAGSLQ